MSEVKYLQTTTSLNNKFIVEAYKKEELREKVVNGFARIDQKTKLKGLRLLVDTRLADGTTIAVNSTVFFKEEILHTQAWAQKILECDGITGQFIIADISQVEYVQPPVQNYTVKLSDGTQAACFHLQRNSAGQCINCGQPFINLNVLR